MEEWYVYILRCGDRSLYTGIARNVAFRLKMHRAGKGAAYTRSHLPVRLVHREGPFDRSGALKREAAIKRLTRPEKQRLLRPASVK
jgi:predicted GIY-YIG superfamily endonuclease